MVFFGGKKLIWRRRRSEASEGGAPRPRISFTAGADSVASMIICRPGDGTTHAARGVVDAQ